MTELESIELARAYVALSNAHRVELILPMFAADAVYTSSAVGEFIGANAIGNMMQGFFAHYADVFWLAENYRFDNGRVSFDFGLQASASDSGELLQRQGIEHIEFDGQGLIKKLEVLVSAGTDSVTEQGG
jgi:nuclear transport factor 2 (NTF2) superfamily protein